MTQISFSSRHTFSSPSGQTPGYIHLAIAACLFGSLFIAIRSGKAQAKPAPPPPDSVLLSNGDTLHGRLVNAAGGKVTFHTDSLGDISIDWDKIKELHTTGNYAVVNSELNQIKKKNAASIPTGTLAVTDQKIVVKPANAGPTAPTPVASAGYIMDEAALDKQIHRRPGFTEGWNGGATAAAAIVTATQNSYLFSGAIDLVRVVPTVPWMAPSNRTSVDFLGSYGKITEPSYTIPATSTTPEVFVPAVVTKSALYHAGAERDEYFAPRYFALAQIAYDHNYSQNLDLQQIYGGGLGWTAIKDAKQELDLKGTIQYERQKFITGESLNLIGSTFSADYALHKKFFTFTQGVAFIPAYNEPSAYSVNESNLLAFAAYKNFSFSLGTLDSYLNNPPSSLPPTKRNSFQFTMGLTYAIKSKY
jgi:Protein of unknown function, DUF481